MATRANPLVSAAVLASTAAIAVATPVIAPSISAAPSPHALAAAKVQLATFADVLSITLADISDTLFNGWGEAISPNQDLNIDWAAQFVGENLRCDFSCTINGPSGVAYMYLDALINGNGAGIANVGGILENPDLPYQPDETKPNYNPYKVQPWGVSAVNYFFEGGPGPGFQYLLSAPFGNPASPLYNPAIAGVINQVFQGALNVTTFYVTALNTLSVLALNVPAVGEYVYGGIQAYLGYPGYPQGLSGILKYVTDVIANGGKNPIPTPLTGGAAATTTLAAAATAAPAVAAPEIVKDVTESTPAVDTKSVDTKSVDAPAGDSKPVNDVKDATPAVSAPEVTPADDAPASSPAVSVPESTPAADTPAVDTPAVSVPDVTPAAPEVKPVEAPSVSLPEAAESTPAAEKAPAAASKPARQRPIRDAIAKIGKQISGAASAAKSGAAADAGAGDSAN